MARVKDRDFFDRLDEVRREGELEREKKKRELNYLYLTQGYRPETASERDVLPRYKRRAD